MKEIALKAGVSIGTVDRVLHFRGHVDPKKEALVKAICKQYGYTSNIVGRAMFMQQHTRYVAVMINSKEINEFSGKVHEGLEKKALELSSYNIEFEYFDLQKLTEDEMLDYFTILSSMDIAGLIIKPLDTPGVKMVLQQYSTKIPVVTCTSDIQEVDRICFVGQDHIKEGRLLANALCRISQDSFNILALVGSFSSVARREKFEGFIEYLQEVQHPYQILKIAEVEPLDTVTYDATMKLLLRYKEANVLYLHPSCLDASLAALKDYGGFAGQKISYGHEGLSAKYILSKQLDFCIYEDPFHQGYLAGSVVFDHMMNGTIPKGKKMILKGYVAFEENC